MPMRSKNITAKTTIIPAIAPIRSDAPTVTYAQLAVTPTRPARHPFIVMPRSGLPMNIHAVMVDVITAAIAELLVVMSMCITSDGFWKLIVEPGLNPNQPSHNTNKPMTASDML